MKTFRMSELHWDDMFVGVKDINQKYLMRLLELKLRKGSREVEGDHREYSLANSRTHQPVLNVTVAPEEADDFQRFQTALLRSKTSLA